MEWILNRPGFCFTSKLHFHSNNGLFGLGCEIICNFNVPIYYHSSNVTVLLWPPFGSKYNLELSNKPSPEPMLAQIGVPTCFVYKVKYFEESIHCIYFVSRRLTQRVKLYSTHTTTEDPFTNTGNFDHMASKLWNEITYPFSNFSGCTIDIWEWKSNFIPHFTLYRCNYLPLLGLKLHDISKRIPWSRNTNPSPHTLIYSMHHWCNPSTLWIRG